ncbi:hypothetical protein KVR01_007641 [Diaporthe batatas]|uniref:uncharacterized protein n=1 Tax=Diaporthe batatas TaxID=748121 RepID=UPI001D05BBD9|nr:uncharacterized protein KVR01_007641 [Diaporthe batatas]KAG8163163.1 hypothetical protein KVR01_007641 [Diaporthe batatas]
MTVHGVASSAVGVIIAVTILLGAATIAIILRFLARRRTDSTGIDDWAALSAYLFLIAVSVCHYLILSPYGSAGHPQSEFDAQQLKQYLIILYADNICYTCCTITVKLSILLLLRRIFTSRSFQIIAYTLTGIFVVWWITVLFFQIFSCYPVHSFWDFEVRQSCIDTTKFYNGVAISNILMDFILLALPLPMIWKLQMTLRKKLQVSFIFILGGFTLICSILRTESLRKLDVNNQTETIVAVGIWTIIECGIGVICSCLPPTARLFRVLSEKMRSTVRSQKQHDDINLLNVGESGTPRLGLPSDGSYSVINEDGLDLKRHGEQKISVNSWTR